MNSVLQILLGLRDTDDQLVALSLHAVADLVPIMGGEVVIGAHRSKIFSQNTPKVCQLIMSYISQIIV